MSGYLNSSALQEYIKLDKRSSSFNLNVKQSKSTIKMIVNLNYTLETSIQRLPCLVLILKVLDLISKLNILPKVFTN